MSRDKKPNVLLEIAVTIVVPALILTYLSGKDRLGTTGALLFALALPLGWGIWDGLKRRKLNWLAVLGVVSTLLRVGIGLRVRSGAGLRQEAERDLTGERRPVPRADQVQHEIRRRGRAGYGHAVAVDHKAVRHDINMRMG